MRKSNRWTTDTAHGLGADLGTKVLVAVDGFSDPERPGVPGELVLPQPPCWRPRCTCEDAFHGAVSHGTTAVGRVQRLHGVPRALAAAAIASAMAQHDEFEDPDLAAAMFLDEVATIDEGRLVRREEHALLPFPAAARITGPHSIRYHLDDEP